MFTHTLVCYANYIYSYFNLHILLYKNVYYMLNSFIACSMYNNFFNQRLYSFYSVLCCRPMLCKSYNIVLLFGNNKFLESKRTRVGSMHADF